MKTLREKKPGFDKNKNEPAAKQKYCRINEILFY